MKQLLYISVIMALVGCDEEKPSSEYTIPMLVEDVEEKIDIIYTDPECNYETIPDVDSIVYFHHQFLDDSIITKRQKRLVDKQLIPYVLDFIYNNRDQKYLGAGIMWVTFNLYQSDSLIDSFSSCEKNGRKLLIDHFNRIKFIDDITLDSILVNSVAIDPL